MTKAIFKKSISVFLLAAMVSNICLPSFAQLRKVNKVTIDETAGSKRATSSVSLPKKEIKKEYPSLVFEEYKLEFEDVDPVILSDEKPLSEREKKIKEAFVKAKYGFEDASRENAGIRDVTNIPSKYTQNYPGDISIDSKLNESVRKLESASDSSYLKSIQTLVFAEYTNEVFKALQDAVKEAGADKSAVNEKIEHALSLVDYPAEYKAIKNKKRFAGMTVPERNSMLADFRSLSAAQKIDKYGIAHEHDLYAAVGDDGKKFSKLLASEKELYESNDEAFFASQIDELVYHIKREINNPGSQKMKNIAASLQKTIDKTDSEIFFINEDLKYYEKAREPWLGEFEMRRLQRRIVDYVTESYQMHNYKLPAPVIEDIIKAINQNAFDDPESLEVFFDLFKEYFIDNRRCKDEASCAVAISSLKAMVAITGLAEELKAEFSAPKLIYTAGDKEYQKYMGIVGRLYGKIFTSKDSQSRFYYHLRDFLTEDHGDDLNSLVHINTLFHLHKIIGDEGYERLMEEEIEKEITVAKYSEYFPVSKAATLLMNLASIYPLLPENLNGKGIQFAIKNTSYNKPMKVRVPALVYLASVEDNSITFTQKQAVADMIKELYCKEYAHYTYNSKEEKEFKDLLAAAYSGIRTDIVQYSTDGKTSVVEKPKQALIPGTAVYNEAVETAKKYGNKKPYPMSCAVKEDVALNKHKRETEGVWRGLEEGAYWLAFGALFRVGGKAVSFFKNYHRAAKQLANAEKAGYTLMTGGGRVTLFGGKFAATALGKELDAMNKVSHILKKQAKLKNMMRKEGLKIISADKNYLRSIPGPEYKGDHTLKYLIKMQRDMKYDVTYTLFNQPTKEQLMKAAEKAAREAEKAAAKAAKSNLKHTGGVNIHVAPEPETRTLILMHGEKQISPDEFMAIVNKLMANM
ncbi:hypothetical protein Dip518_001363 [Parelusimicrobium proximum]|uniref:hypothetical protein n=1 Tax=Parelusimicrobium proximum TaxID=3228953 RepID=UPI003D172C9E